MIKINLSSVPLTSIFQGHWQFLWSTDLQVRARAKRLRNSVTAWLFFKLVMAVFFVLEISKLIRIWAVLLIVRAARKICFNQSQALPSFGRLQVIIMDFCSRSQTSFAGKPVRCRRETLAVFLGYTIMSKRKRQSENRHILCRPRFVKIFRTVNWTIGQMPLFTI